jgi:hypothetical protein
MHHTRELVQQMIRSPLAERRRFLKLVGASALTYPFLRSVPSYANMTAGSDPVFLVLLFSACGVVRYKWGATGNAPTSCSPPTAPADATTSPLVFRDTLSPFANAVPLDGSAAVDLTKYVTVLDGLNNAAANGGTHEAGFASLWTGSTILNNTNGATTGPSIDQAIAPLLASQLGITVPYAAGLPLYAMSSADYNTTSVQTRMLYNSSAGWVAPYSSGITPGSVQTVLGQVFPTMASSSSSGPNPTSAIRSATINNLNSELTALQSRLCSEDKNQIANLQSLWNATYTGIASAATAAASCMTPTLPGTLPAAGSDPYPYNVAAMSNILAMALACNLTRVASLQLSHALSPVVHSWLSTSAAPQTTTHHLYSHAGPTSLYQLGADLYATNGMSTSTEQTFASMYTDATPANLPGPQLANIDNWYATQVASLAATMSKLPAPGSSGKSLLDQSVICWGSELDMGASHNHDNTPFVLIGGGGGALKTNQLVGFPMNLANNASNRTNGSQTSSTGNRFHNDLLLTLAKVMGVDVGNSFGTAGLCTGPIIELLTSA